MSDASVTLERSLSPSACVQASLLQALSDWPVFVSYRDAEVSAAPLPLLVYPGMPLKDWYEKVHERQETVGPLGCYFLKGVVVREHLLMFKNGQLLVDQSHLSDVSIEWAAQYKIAQDTPEIATRSIQAPLINALGPGYLIYGHWIVDFLPRIAIAKSVLGDAFRDFKILLPSNAPSWIYELCKCLLHLDRNSFYEFNSGSERILAETLCVPTYAHSQDYGFHPFFRELFSQGGGERVNAGKKLCISRKNMESGTVGLWKVFENRALFEDIAVSRGYQIVYPELMSFKEQMDLFSSASVVLGEFGSALHNAVFSARGTVIGALRCPSPIQSRIAATFGHRLAYLFPESEWLDDQGITRYACGASKIEEFIDFIDSKSIEPFEARQ